MALWEFSDSNSHGPNLCTSQFWIMIVLFCYCLDLCFYYIVYLAAVQGLLTSWDAPLFPMNLISWYQGRVLSQVNWLVQRSVIPFGLLHMIIVGLIGEVQRSKVEASMRKLLALQSLTSPRIFYPKNWQSYHEHTTLRSHET